MGIARAAAFLAALLCGAAALTLLRERTWPRWAGIALVLAVGVLLAAPSDAAPARAARLHRAVVLHQRLDLPDRAERRPGAGRREPLRPRLPAVGPRALLHARRERVRAGARARGGAAAFRLLPRRAAERGRLARAPGPVRRLPAARDALPRSAALAAALRVPGAARLAAGGRARCWCATRWRCARAWFGQNDPTSLLLLVLAFALVTRSRFGWAAASLAGAVLLKQFALVALPFLALMAMQVGRRPRAAQARRRWSSAACRSRGCSRS